ncbi:MAG TPA: hypothetical protein VMT42_04255 [candidate division Zixibacteria bacterium]|nr:hypothetical protein [candidate division Zixibacteria bacterium]
MISKGVQKQRESDAGVLLEGFFEMLARSVSRIPNSILSKHYLDFETNSRIIYGKADGLRL